MWRNNYVYRVRLDHSKKTLQYIFGRLYENDLVYLVAYNMIFKKPTGINSRNVLMKVTGYEFS